MCRLYKPASLNCLRPLAVSAPPHNNANAPGAIEKLAKEDPRRARTGQVLDDRIAARRSELRKGKKTKTAGADAVSVGVVTATTHKNGGVEEQEGQEAAVAEAFDAMDEDSDDDDDSQGEDGDEEEEEEAREGLEEDNIRELLAGGRGKVWWYHACSTIRR